MAELDLATPPERPEPVRLRAADQGLAACLAAIACTRIEGPPMADALHMLVHFYPAANETAPQMPAVIEAAKAVINTMDKRRTPGGVGPWAAAMLEASAASAEFFRWRAALAYDASRANSGGM